MKFVPYDIGTYRVKAQSVEGNYIVDAIEWTCSCDGYEFYWCCRHLRELRRQFARLPMIVGMRAHARRIK